MASQLTEAEQRARARTIVSEFVDQLQAAFTSKDISAIQGLLLPEGYVRE